MANEEDFLEHLIGDTDDNEESKRSWFRRRKKGITTSTKDKKEAELIKLYSNAYLSLRLAFFGQLNKTCQKHDANFERIVNALGRDGRIGNHYNKPPFKIGGKCLPKDLTNLAIQTADPLLQAVTHLISK